MNKLYRKLKSCTLVKGISMTLERWLEAQNISFKDFESISGVPYQRISEHIRLNKPLSEKHVLMILKATNCNVSPETLRPSLKPIIQLISDKKRALVRRMTGFTFALAVVLGIFATVIFQSPTEIPDSVIAESWHHYEEARNAANNGDLEFALSHLDAIKKNTPAWYESRDLHWKVKDDLNMYAQTKSKAMQK